MMDSLIVRLTNRSRLAAGCGQKTDHPLNMVRLMEEAVEALEKQAWKRIDEVEPPAACHVLAARFDDSVGEWMMGYVMSPPAAPFTHFMMPGAPAR